MDKNLAEAIKIAYRSTNKRHLTGCVIVNPHGDIISNGWSHVGNWRRYDLYSTHAEHHALARARHIRDELKGCTIYIATIARKSEAITNSQPCFSCATALVAVGIEVAYFTVKDKEFLGNSMYLPDELNELKVYPYPD